MKKNTHGTYNKDVLVNCICDNSFKVNATVPGPIKIESCPKCHPAYNKGQIETKVIRGRMERFQERQTKTKTLKSKSAK